MSLRRVLSPRSVESSAPVSDGAVWRATVTEVLTGGMVWVLAPGLMGQEPIGPLPVFGGSMPVLGTQVLILAVGGRKDDMVVLPPAG